eukprot:gene12199-2820_t
MGRRRAGEDFWRYIFRRFSQQLWPGLQAKLTSICMRLAKEQFGKAYKQTLGLDFFLKRLTLPGHINVTLQVWDIGGQQLGGNMLETYLFGAQAVLLIYDVTNHSSFENVSDWVDVIKSTVGPDAKLPYLALVGNKVDLEHMRIVKAEKHAEFALTNNMHRKERGFRERVPCSVTFSSVVEETNKARFC